MRLHPLVVFIAFISACGGSTPTPATEPPPLPVARRAAGVVPPPRDDGRLPPGARPTHYALELSIDPKKKTFSGRTRIEIALAVPSDVVVLHGRDLALRDVTAQTARGKIAGKAEARAAFGATEVKDEIVLAFDQELPAGEAVLEVDYDAPFNQELRGAFRVEQPDASYVFTNFEPSDARRMFPCFDEPAFKTPFRLTVLVPKGNLAFANTSEVGRSEDPKSGLVAFEFAPTAPLPTYLVAVAVGPLEVLEGPKTPVPLRVIAAKGKAPLGKMALEMAGPLLERYAQYFAQPYPYEKLDLVAIPNFAAGGMENAGFITLAEELVFVEEAGSVAAKRELAISLAHEVAHQWFGNLVTMSWWDEIWLKESFTEWVSRKIVDAWRPETKTALQTVSSKSWTMLEDALPASRPIRKPARTAQEIQDNYNPLIWNKGAPLVGMIEAWLGADAFRDGVRGYMRKHRNGTVTSADLYAALTAVSAGSDVGKVVDSFIAQSGVPVVTAELDCGAVAKKEAKGLAPGSAEKPPALRLRQEEYRYLDRTEPSRKTWRIPVCVRHDAGGTPVNQCTLLEGEETRLELLSARGRETSCPTFFYPNAEEVGYFRHRLALADLERVASRGLGKLSEPERLGLVANAWAAVWSGHLPLSRYFDLLRGFKGETSRLVLEQIEDTLFEASGVVVSDAERPAFARFVREVLRPAGKRAGFSPKKDESEETKVARSGVLFTLGALGQDPAVLAEASKRASAWLDHPAEGDRDLANIVLVLAAKRDDPKMFDRLLGVLKSDAPMEVRDLARKGLTAFEKPAHMERVLDLLLDGTLNPRDAHAVLMPLLRRAKTLDMTLAWVDRHFDAIAKASPKVPYVIARAPLALCDAERARTVAAAWRPRLEKLDAATMLDEYAQTAVRCAALADKEGAPTRAWLAARGHGT